MLNREKQFFWGVKIAAAIISLLILIAVLWKYWRKSSSGGQTVAVQGQPPALNMTVQGQPPALNMNEFVQGSV
jgi:ABC-type glucose/galactose transport system permease subunit